MAENQIVGGERKRASERGSFLFLCVRLDRKRAFLDQYVCYEAEDLRLVREQVQPMPDDRIIETDESFSEENPTSVLQPVDSAGGDLKLNGVLFIDRRHFHSPNFETNAALKPMLPF